MAIFSYSNRTRAIGVWLIVMILLVVCMISLGGATRLTNSGLSITEWRPITGALPPLSDAAWASEFSKYQQIPEFSAEHPEMGLAGFKFIYFMEWSHRQLGRLIGVVYFFPFVLFLTLKRFEPGKAWRFAILLFLIGLQGGIGWWMVHSGLQENRVDVSQYRLAVHLGMAFIILAMLLWTWLDNHQNWPSAYLRPRLYKRSALVAFLVFLQIVCGALVAGTHAGRTYNTWPMMDGGFVPNGYFAQSPVWRNIFENVASIQFNHRLLGYLVFLAVIWTWVSAVQCKELQIRRLAGLLMMAVVAQITLGIITLLQVVPLKLAIAHQGGAIIVFMLAIWMVRTTKIRLHH